LGEAVKRVSSDVRKKHPDVTWRAAAAMRDFLIHDYSEIDVEAVWNTIKKDLPKFRTGVESVVRDYGR
jgi:uncharacterized protein with HEPN domain